jgi:hypothetical protein
MSTETDNSVDTMFANQASELLRGSGVPAARADELVARALASSKGIIGIIAGRVVRVVAGGCGEPGTPGAVGGAEAPEPGGAHTPPAGSSDEVPEQTPPREEQ